ncbi:MAG: hypothetical protein U0359_27825 [Byssovorax sp.]
MNLPPRLSQSGRFLRARALWAVVFAIVAAGARLAGPAPPPRTPEGVAAMLGAAVGGEVRPEDFIWEERGGALADLLLGRRVLFLAKKAGATGAEPRADLYRARVRLTRGGRPLHLAAAWNLSESPLGDERDLLARDHRASYATLAGGAVQGITLLDLGGAEPLPQGASRSARIGAAIDALLDTGSFAGIGKVEITFGAPPAEAREELTADSLVMALGADAVPAALDLQGAALATGTRNPYGARAQRIPRRPRALGEALVRAARAYAGELPAAALAALVRLGDKRPAAPAAPQIFPGREPPAPIAPVDDWPPPAIKPEVSPPLPGEGVWAPADGDLVPQAEGELSPIFVTAIRPSTRRPELLVRMAVLDLRRLDLHLQPGVDAPRPSTGLRGYGRLPSGAAAEPVVAAFAVPSLTPDSDVDEPKLGFAADRALLVPPIAGAASLAFGHDGALSFGPWLAGPTLPPAFDGLLQTPDALVGGAEAPPKVPLPGASRPAERAGFGLLPSGHGVFAWGTGIEAAHLAAALAAAGCTYAVPLGGAPGPAGFALLHAPKTAADPWQTRRLDPAMSFDPDALAGSSPGAFVYASRRSTLPSIPLGAPPAGSEPAAAGWTVDPGKQPSPAWIPAIHAGTESHLGAQVHLTTFAPGRFTFRMRAGSREPATKAAAALPTALPVPEQARALAAIGLGFGKKKGARGLGIEGAIGLPLRGEAAGALVLDKGRLSIVPSAGFKPPAGGDFTELPLTADGGKLRPEAREVGSMRPRAALCALDDGTLVIASTTFDSDEATTQALLDRGCPRVVALDRGGHAAAFVHRAGTETPPADRYESTVLYGLDLPMPGRARRLTAE